MICRGFKQRRYIWQEIGTIGKCYFWIAKSIPKWTLKDFNSLYFIVSMYCFFPGGYLSSVSYMQSVPQLIPHKSSLLQKSTCLHCKTLEHIIIIPHPAIFCSLAASFSYKITATRDITITFVLSDLFAMLQYKHRYTVTT